MAAGRTSFACMGACAMVAPCQILGASVVSLDATVRVVGHARDAEARAAGNRGRAAGVREAREGHSLAVVRRVRDEWPGGALGRHMFARS